MLRKCKWFCVVLIWVLHYVIFWFLVKFYFIGTPVCDMAPITKQCKVGGGRGIGYLSNKYICPSDVINIILIYGILNPLREFNNFGKPRCIFKIQCDFFIQTVRKTYYIKFHHYYYFVFSRKVFGLHMHMCYGAFVYIFVYRNN